MSYIEWKIDYELGFSQIDKQHMNLVNIINQLHELISKDKENVPKAEAKKILDSMTLYTVNHFETEEQLLKSCGYANFTAHKNQHDQFKKTVEKYYELFNSGIINPEEIADFLKNWLLGHIIKEDRNYVSILKSKGIK